MPFGSAMLGSVAAFASVGSIKKSLIATSKSIDATRKMADIPDVSNEALIGLESAAG